MRTRIFIALAVLLAVIGGGFALERERQVRSADRSVPAADPAPAVSDTVSDTAQSRPADALEGFVFEVRDTPAGREQGLSGRESVPPGYGMLFVFERPDRYGFWMKDMRVPIDIVWLSDTGVVLGIEEAARPESFPTVFYPPAPVRFVLETRAGEARARGWGIGTDLALPLPYE